MELIVVKYEININEFQGPLDLLLHLIKQSNISIYQISIDLITKQYLDYIQKMEELNLDIASEYLVMAAELIEIKSSSLLPKQNIEDDEFEEDPKEKLINRLLEYEQYKKMTSTLKELEEYRQEIYTREPDNLLDFKDNEEVDYGINLNDLLNALNNFLEQKELVKPLNTKITNKEYSVSIRSNEIRNILKKKKKVNFTELFEVFTKEYVVITFLSILAMTRKQEIEIEQENNFKNIIIKEKGVE
ncbi:MAG: segregation/condensation protein A [Firmicutes bacterium]|nr:segregation/condensation protein A [Bacillota bacterium]